MKTFPLLAACSALVLSACGGGGFGSGVKTVGVRPTPDKPAVVMAPSKATAFEQTATGRNAWLEGQLRTSINRELDQSGRFQSVKTGAPDGQVLVHSIRHGLIEVASNQYAVTVNVDVALVGRNGKSAGSRELSATAGQIRPLVDFEDSKNYEEALGSAVDKLALELVSQL